MGWFIAQSLAFIIIAAVLGLAIGIWTGWLVWGRRARGKHVAERAEAAARSAAVPSGAAAGARKPAEAAATDVAKPGKPAVATKSGDKKNDKKSRGKKSAEPAPAVVGAAADETPDAGTTTASDAVLPVADSASAPDTDGADAERTGGTGAEVTTPAGTAGSDVVAEAEAVARKAAEAGAATTTAAATPGAVEAPEAGTAGKAQDDLRRIEGIGPKIASALVAAGYPTYARIASATEEELREAVASQGIKFAPSASSWADQAQYLVDRDTDGLGEYQDYLVGGQDRASRFKENVDYTDVDEIEDAQAKTAALAEDEAKTEAADQAPEGEPQDLRRIEGIGPKIDSTLKAAGYTTYARIAGASEAEIRDVLTAGGIKFAPAANSWAEQAQYLVDGDEDGLREFQDYLVGGQDRASAFKENVDYTDVDEIEDAQAKTTALAEDEAKTETTDQAPEGEPADSETAGDSEPASEVKA